MKFELGVRNELSSRLVSKQVLLPQQSLTSVFGMGTGGPSALKSRTVSLQPIEEIISRKETQTVEAEPADTIS